MLQSVLRHVIITASTLLVFFILLFAYTKFAGPIPFNINSVTTSKSDAFSVTGEGTASTKPDSAVVTVGVQSNGQTAKTAQESMNEKINKVSEAVKKLGIEEKDIKTSNYNVFPTYDYRESTQRITGYQGSTTLIITIKDTEKVNTIVDTATKEGANTIGDVRFEVADKAKAENEAREKAVQNAKQKAEQAAKAAGFTLGKIINYQENYGGGYPIPMRGSFGAANLEKDAVAPVTQIEPGSSEIKINVTLSYEVR